MKMIPKSLEVGDLVWAKMRGYSPWPGKIMEPPEKEKHKKAHHYVFFYGSENYAWIPDDNILLHSENLVKLYSEKKNANLLNAINIIVKASKDGTKSQKPYESVTKQEESSEKQASKHVSSPKTPTVPRIKKEKKVPAKKMSIVKNKKRSLSGDRSKADSSSGFTIPPKIFRDDTYENLFANIPPNTGYNGDALPSTLGLLSRSAYVERPHTPPIDLQTENAILKEKDIQPTEKKIGFLGLGKLGQGIVKNLIQSGHQVTIWNRSTEKCQPFVNIGAEKAPTPADVIMASDITFCCVSDTDAAKQLVFGNCGILKGLEASNAESKGYVEMTSMDPRTSQAIAKEVKNKGGRYLEAPLSGSRLQAIEGTLFVLGAGDKSLFEECDSCFQAIAKHTVFLGGDVGSASKLNTVHSMLVGGVYAALAEALALVKRTGLKEENFLNILQYGVLDNQEIIEKGKAMVKNEYTSNTPLKHVQKDLNLGMLLGASCKQPMPIFAAANEAYKHLKLLRYSDHDVSAIYEGTGR